MACRRVCRSFSQLWPHCLKGYRCMLVRPECGVRWASSSTAPLDMDRRYIPRRAVLYVPGNDIKKLTKIVGLKADCAVMDCEDGVASNRKEEARQTIRKMLDELDFGHTEPVVRINSVQSGLAEDDLRVTLSAARLPPTIMVPKVDDVDHVNWVHDKLSMALKDRGPGIKVNLITFVESAVGLLNLRDVCRRAVELSTKEEASFQMEGVVFGSDDFCADIGATRTTAAKELLYARQHTLLVAKAFRLQAIDMVHINFKDLDGLRTQSYEGAQMGFTGKQVIHPSQVAVVQSAFTPSEEKVEWAVELIKAFEEHQGSGKGAFTFRGSMIDMPLLLQAKNIVQLAQATQASKS